MGLKGIGNAVPVIYLSFSMKLLIIAFIGWLLPAGIVAQVNIYEWKSLAIGGGGFVSAVIPSKTEAGLVYARTDVGGAYRWDNAAARWVPLQDWVSQDEPVY